MITGYKQIDTNLDIKNTKLITIASRPALGKTTFLLNILNNIAINNNNKVLYFNFENSRILLSNKLLCIHNNKDYTNVKMYELAINEEMNYLKNITFYFDDSINLNNTLKTKSYWNNSKSIYIENIIEICKEQISKKNINYIIIDNIDFVYCNNGNIYNVLVKLKELAEELNIKIYITTGLTRNLEERKDHKPIKTDLINYNEINAMSDVVILLYREDYYNDEICKTMEVNICKNNYGNCENVKLNKEKRIILKP